MFSFFNGNENIFLFYEGRKFWKCVFAKSAGIHAKTKLFNTIQDLYLEKVISYCKAFLNVKKGQVWKYKVIKEIDLDICYSKTTLLSVDSEWCEIRALLVVFSLEAVQCTYTVCPFDKLLFIILWIKQLPKPISPMSKGTFNDYNFVLFWPPPTSTWTFFCIFWTTYHLFLSTKSLMSPKITTINFLMESLHSNTLKQRILPFLFSFLLRIKKKDSMKCFQEKFSQELIIVMLSIGLIGSQGCFRIKTLVTVLIISEQENLKKHRRIIFTCFDFDILIEIWFRKWTTCGRWIGAALTQNK